MKRFIGTWHIYEMEEWDEDYLNMEVQAYIKVGPHDQGDFQFGLVRGSMDCELVKIGQEERLEFTWAGNDEMDEAFGSGWLQLKGEQTIEGRIKFHEGDSSLFSAKQVE